MRGADPGDVQATQVLVDAPLFLSVEMRGAPGGYDYGDASRVVRAVWIYWSKLPEIRTLPGTPGFASSTGFRLRKVTGLSSGKVYSQRKESERAWTWTPCMN
jgi:hypothetical protein